MCVCLCAVAFRVSFLDSVIGLLRGLCLESVRGCRPKLFVYVEGMATRTDASQPTPTLGLPSLTRPPKTHTLEQPAWVGQKARDIETPGAATGAAKPGGGI